MLLPSASPEDRVRQIVDGLPPLPPTLRYYDDFWDSNRSIRNPGKNDAWEITIDGVTHRLDFLVFGNEQAAVLKRAFAWQITLYDPETVIGIYSHIKNMKQADRILFIDSMLLLKPYDFRELWIARVTSLAHHQQTALKTVLFALCDLDIAAWCRDYRDYVSKLPHTKKDSYRTVRTGDCFVPLDQQSLLIEHLDDLNRMIMDRPESVTDEEIRNACILVVSFQYAFRPGQVARIRMPDVRVFNTGAVHFMAVLTKKRNNQDRQRVTRRVKREWCPLFIEYGKRRNKAPITRKNIPVDSFFGLTPNEVSSAIIELTTHLTGEEWTPTDLRHSAAQRLVDAGTSHLSLAEFMGHSDIRTGTVYFETSPTQAQRINQALALSNIYTSVAEVAKTKTIDKAALLRMPPDKQIGGVPHGIPIAGIGACTSGQSLCSKNPILSCYTCRRFMPVRDATIHRQVVDDLRPIVRAFADASRGNIESPAYTQLRRMLTSALTVAEDIESEGPANE